MRSRSDPAPTPRTSTPRAARRTETMTRKEAVRQTHQEDVLVSLGFTRAEAEALRRISLTLHRWAEHECNGTIERREDDGNRPYWSNPNTGGRHYVARVPDREAG